MKMVLRTGKGVKMKRAKVRELMGFKMEGLSSEVRIQLIQELIPLGLMHVQEELEEEARRLAGACLPQAGGGIKGMDGPAM